MEWTGRFHAPTVLLPRKELLGGALSRSESGGEEKNPHSCRKYNPDRPVSSLVTELYQILSRVNWKQHTMTSSRGNSSCQYGVNFQRFGDSLLPTWQTDGTDRPKGLGCVRSSSKLQIWSQNNSRKEVTVYIRGPTNIPQRIWWRWKTETPLRHHIQHNGSLLSTTASRTALGPTDPPIQCVPGSLSLGVKRPGREADHSPPSSAESRMRGAIPHSPNKPSWRGALL
jgi:hypothetical protein